MMFSKSFVVLFFALFSFKVHCVLNPTSALPVDTGSLVGAVQNTTSTPVQGIVSGVTQTGQNLPNVLPEAAAIVPAPTEATGNATEGVTGSVVPAVTGILPSGVQGVIPSTGSLPTNPGEVVQTAENATQGVTGGVVPAVTGALPSPSVSTNPAETVQSVENTTSGVVSGVTGAASGLPTGALPTGVLPSGVLPSGVVPSGVLPTGVLPSGILPGGVVPTTGSLLPTTPGINTGPNLLPFSTVNCGEGIVQTDTCNITCALNPSCQSLGFNLTALPCTCPSEICSDGQIYGAPGYLADGPLNSTQINSQPHVVAPCFDCVQAQIAPEGTQIGSCPVQTEIVYVATPAAGTSSNKKKKKEQ